MGLEDTFWKVLSKRQCILFGRECLAAALWSFLAIFLRLVLYFCRCEAWSSYGIIWAFPYSIQVTLLPFLTGTYSYCLLQIFRRQFKLFNECYPVLSVRVTEMILGEINNNLSSISGHLIRFSLQPEQEF